jgi:hypothetical protein
VVVEISVYHPVTCPEIEHLLQLLGLEIYLSMTHFTLWSRDLGRRALIGLEESSGPFI